MSAAAVDHFSTDQLRALVAELAQFSSTLRDRGSRYATHGRVGPLTVDPNTVSALVRGSRLYHTLWEWANQEWVPDCDCPAGPYCKHAYALACHMLSESGAEARLADRRLQRLLPRDVRVGPAWEDRQPSHVSVHRHATPAARGAAAILDRIRSAPNAWARQYALADLIPHDLRTHLNFYLPPFPQLLEEPDPDIRCWRLAQEIPKRAGGWLPAVLEPYRQRPDLVARIAHRARAALAAELTQWAQQQRVTAHRRLRVVLALAAEASGDPFVYCEARLTTPRLHDAPRTMGQLQQLRSELRRAPGVLAPEEIALLDWLLDLQQGAFTTHTYGASPTLRLTGRGLQSFAARFADSSLVTWVTDGAPDLTTRGGVSAGDPVRFCPVPVRLLPTCVSREGAACIDLLFLWSDGTQRALGDAVYLRGASDYASTQPSFVLANGALSLVVEEPPRSLVRNFCEAGGLPLEPGERRPILELLAANFPHLQSTLAAHTRFHPVRPIIALDLREDDWLQIRLFADAGREPWLPGTPPAPDAILFEYTPERRWERGVPASSGDADTARAHSSLSEDGDGGAAEVGAAHATVAADTDRAAWLEAPDPSRSAPAIDWLGMLPAVSGSKKSPGGRQCAWQDRAIGWWMQASRKGMEVLAEAWDRRPRGVAFFATERLHRLLSGQDRIVPLLRITSSGLDWFSVSAEWESEGWQLSDADLAKLRAATTRFVKLSSGWIRRDAAAVHDETAQALADLGIEAGQGEQRVTMWQLASAQPENLQVLERLAGDAQAVAAAQRLRERVAGFTGLPHVPPPPGLVADLRPYQQRGLDFLAYTSSLGIGALLADDMGLGKTVQALAWLRCLQEQDPDGGPSLVVCPASVVHNWAREAERFVPSVRALLLTSGSARHDLRKEIPQHDLIVTNYALLRRDLEEWRKLEWRAVILDEAQNIKNPDAAVTRAAQALNARHRLALTGTPLENRALDLWSIMSFLNPGYLGNRAQFEGRFDRLDAPPHVRTLLAAKLRPVLLRRTKQAVAPDLPDRIEERIDCELTTEQRHLYLAELQRCRALVDRLSAEPDGIRQNKIHILAALTRLRQICCHPALARGKATLGSGKFDALFELLEPLLAEGHKVLLFSQFVECLKLLKTEMRRRAIVAHVLTGQTTKRKEVVDAFQNAPDACVFLISLKAGGTGLNLTAASYVVLFDPWWNPAVEAQAIDRTHRIGQDRTVIAYRLLTLGTIEEKIWELQQRKAALARDILGEGGFARALTRADLDYLLAET